MHFKHNVESREFYHRRTTIFLEKQASYDVKVRALETAFSVHATTSFEWVFVNWALKISYTIRS